MQNKSISKSYRWLFSSELTLFGFLRAAICTFFSFFVWLIMPSASTFRPQAMQTPQLNGRKTVQFNKFIWKPTYDIWKILPPPRHIHYRPRLINLKTQVPNMVPAARPNQHWHFKLWFFFSRFYQFIFFFFFKKSIFVSLILNSERKKNSHYQLQLHILND